MAVYYINGTSNSGATFGTSGYFYPLYLTAAEANSASDNTAGTSHAHTFEEATNITFYMPTTGATPQGHALATVPSGNYSGEVYISYTSPIAEENVEDIGLGVLAGDTFNSWRKKTNDVARETITNASLISSVDTRLTRLLSVTGGENNIMTLTSSDNITGEKEFEGIVKFSAADDSTNAIQVGADGKIYVESSSFKFTKSIDLHSAGAEIKASDFDVPTGRTKYAGVQYTWPSQPPVPGQILKSGSGNTLNWATETAAEANVEAFVIEDPNPIGSIHQWSTNGAPSKWLICDGSAVSRATYSDLFAVIGETYGTGDGGSTFNLPDLRARVPVGIGTNIDANGVSAAFVLGQTNATVDGSPLSGGEYQHTLTAAQSGLPSHTHTVTTMGNGNTWLTTYSRGGTHGSERDQAVLTTSTAGGDDATSAHNVIQPFIALNYIIKAQGSTIVTQNLKPENGLLLSSDGGATYSSNTSNILQSGADNRIKLDVDSNNFEFSGNTLKLKDDLSITTATFPDTTPTASASSSLTTTTQGLAFPFTKYFETEFVSPNTSSAIITPIDHNLGGSPAFTYVTMICTSDDQGYVVGDEIPFNSPNNISNNHGPTLYFTSSQFKFTTYGYVYVTSADLATSVIATDFNKWKWRIKAWR